jgi:hypothetical protein
LDSSLAGHVQNRFSWLCSVAANATFSPLNVSPTFAAKHLHPRLIWDRCYDFKTIFSPKNLPKNLAFFVQAAASFYKKIIITMVFEKNAKFFAESCHKLHKIAIITSTPVKHSFSFLLEGNPLSGIHLVEITVF